MLIKPWGTRGSCSTVQSDKLEYGGNTVCYQIITDEDSNEQEYIIFDAGTGIIQLGDSLPSKGKVHLFISHWHLDHVCGLSFFKPLHSPDWEVNLYLPENQKHLLTTFFNGIFFPLEAKHLRCKLNVMELNEKEKIQVGKITIETPIVPHAGLCHGFKISSDKGTAVIMSDVEISADRKEDTELVKKIIDGAGICFVDSYYTENEYETHVGWGHTALEYWIEILENTSIKHIVFTHHHIRRTDKEIDALHELFASVAEAKMLKISFAKEALSYCVENPIYVSGFVPVVNPVEWINEFSMELLGYNDNFTVIDRILYEARRITLAEAGTVYLVEGDELVFSYTHNDRLFALDKSNKYVYSNIRLPIATNSIAGYCAKTKETLNLKDVRNFPSDYPFYFNDAFDLETNYLTVSMYCVPLLGHEGKLLGVLQLINRQENGKSVSFPDKIASLVTLLTTITTNAIERTKLIEEMIFRLQHIISLHDPSETGPHVERVGAVSAEIYTYLANKTGIDLDKSYNFRGQLRMAAKLHDMGKIGIPKEILKKPARLTDEEFEIMKSHASIGAGIFSLTIDSSEDLAKNVALHHHQKWNGKGYTGDKNVQILAGKDIPLEARIVAVADVFDALISKRCYKPQWTWKDAMDIIEQDSGSHFDPEVVEAFFAIEDTVKMIYEKYKD